MTTATERTGNFFKSDLYKIHDVVQNTMIVFPKEIIIATLRDFFSEDSYYGYRRDNFGFPQTPDHTDLPITAGLHDNVTTRLYIGENYRFDGIFYPAILVKNAGGRYVPISINRDRGKVYWTERSFDDGYGNITTFRNPDSFAFSGAWEGQMAIDIKTRSLRSRDDLVELVALCLQDITFESLKNAGIVVKPLSWGAPSEIDDRNDKLFQQTITLDIRSEWERRIPIGNVLEVINFAIEFGRVDVPNAPIAPNLTINTESSFLEIMSNAAFTTYSR